MKSWATLAVDETHLLAKHYTPGRQGHKVRSIAIHHNAGNLSLRGIHDVWQTREASAHYQVDAAGRIGRYVRDEDTAWHAGDWLANLQTIAIEHANSVSTSGPVTAKTLEEGAHLVAALCVFHKLGRPQWWVNVFPHSHWSSTACPGHLHPSGSQGPAYMGRAQHWYDAMTGKTTIGGIAGMTVEQFWDHRVKRGGKRIPAIQELADAKTAATAARDLLAPIKRDGKYVSVRQEIADAKTAALANQAQLVALTSAVEALAQTQGVAPERVEAILREAVAEALDGLTVSGTVTIEGADQ